MTVIEGIRRDREDLARVLKNHSGIRRIVEDLYPDTAHFIYELLQNAEDTRASEASFVLSPNELAFEHNGRPFDEADIRGITDIGEGTKTRDDDKIGRFGIGFKAVFPYTETPRIWSPTYAFEISDMVLPSELPSDPTLEKHTRFEFRFNSEKKPRPQAFSEVSDGLEEISDNTLLFLSHIEEIQWRIEGGKEGRLLRVLHSDQHIEILREIDGKPTESSHFLRFSEPVDGLEHQNIAIAFELEMLAGDDRFDPAKPIAKQFRIRPAKRGCVAVYFTAAKETSNLRFHIHGPFVPELSRSSIKDTAANEPLFDQLAGLAARSLFAIRDFRLLDRDFLEVLPNPEDEVSNRYTCIAEAILDAMNNQPLTPVLSGCHAPAKKLLQASAALKALLDREDRRFLSDSLDGREDWAIGATQRNSRVDRLLRALDIEDWDAEQFLEVLDSNLDLGGRFNRKTYDWDEGPDHGFLKWLRSKSNEWLLDREDRRFLSDSLDGREDWAIGATQRNSRVDRLLRALDIEDWDAEQFLEVLDSNLDLGGRFNRKTYDWDEGPDHGFLKWLRSKSNEWHRALYALLYRAFQEELWRFNNLCIVKISDGEYLRGTEAFFPTSENQVDLILPRVARDTYSGDGSRIEQDRARQFLEGIGVREVGEFQQVEAILQQRYAKPTNAISWKTHETDLRRFMLLLKEDKNAGSLFENYFILQGADGQWHKPSGIYLDSPYAETGLQAYFEPLVAQATRSALSSSYTTFDMLEQFVEFSRTCGAADYLEICETSCSRNPRVSYLYSAPGSNFTGTGIDRDYFIPSLDQLFQCSTVRLSCLVWNTLCKKSNVTAILQARYRYNQSNQSHVADSQIVHQLRNGAWIPQADGKFVCPPQASRDLLPDEGFPFDPGSPWIAAIGFGADTAKRVEERQRNQEMAAKLGFADEATLADARRFAGLPPGTRQRILEEHESFLDLPEREPTDQEQRAKSVRQEARNAPERSTDKRQRSVSVNRDEIKREGSVPYLRDQYTNTDGVTICQACKDALPFKLADSNYYLEAVEFLSKLGRHYYQNYLALCPNHAAMLMHANESKDEMMEVFLNLDGSELELILAGRRVSFYFTDTHVNDLRVIIEVDDQD